MRFLKFHCHELEPRCFVCCYRCWQKKKSFSWPLPTCSDITLSPLVLLLFLGAAKESSQNECHLFSKSCAEKHHQGVPEWAVRRLALRQQLDTRCECKPLVLLALMRSTEGHCWGRDPTWMLDYLSPTCALLTQNGCHCQHLLMQEQSRKCS